MARYKANADFQRDYYKWGTTTKSVLLCLCNVITPLSFLALIMIYIPMAHTKQSGASRRRRSTFDGSTVQYHSLADSLGGLRQLPWKQRAESKQKVLEVPVLTMNILDSSQLPATVTS